MRKLKLIKNTISSLMYQICTIICGFIVPRFILQAYGSEVNGLVNSITQFLSIISLLELGVGAVVRSALYKPLADNDNSLISKIVISASSFFKKLAFILVLYVLVLIVVYPSISKQNFSWAYSAILVIVIGISSFAQYYFGIVNSILLTADQKGYIQYSTQTITLIANTLACVLLIGIGASIHIVKLATSLIYLVRPVILHYYVSTHYNIDRNITYTEEPIKQKWNGVAQHFAAVILNNTDSIVLTIFSSLANVSIYSVYNNVVNGVDLLISALTNNITSLVGDLLARNEMKKLYTVFGWIEWAIHTGTVFFFGCTAILIVPFVKIYTYGITDTNYIQPLFGYLITLAYAGHCLRLPYNILILAGGHYRQTQRCYVIAAILNVVISIAAVSKWGLVGVTIGTIIAMFYQTIWMALYDSRNILNWPLKNFLKQSVVDTITFIAMYLLMGRFDTGKENYISWIILACVTAIISIVVIVVINLIFYRNYVIILFKKVSPLSIYHFKNRKH